MVVSLKDNFVLNNTKTDSNVTITNSTENNSMMNNHLNEEKDVLRVYAPSKQGWLYSWSSDIPAGHF